MDKHADDHIEEVTTHTSHQDDNLKQTDTMGTVKLTEGVIVYVPAATADPRDPLNMPRWQKYVVLVILSIFSCLGLSLVAGFGSLLAFYIPEYVAQGKTYDDITHLMTYPTLFMGIGNLIGLPVAIAVGRKVVLIGSTMVLIIGSILSATAQNYEWLLGSRIILGLAAGQSEALVPMIVQECFFLHERSHYLMVQQFIQILLTTVWVILASPIASGIGTKWYFFLAAFLAAFQLILAVLFLPETKYKRSMSSFQEISSEVSSTDVERSLEKDESKQFCTVKPPLDFENYERRNFQSDLRLWIGKPEWSKIPETLYHCFQLLLFPNVLWALCLNGLTIGINVAIGTTYSNILEAAPYHWKSSIISYVNCGQILVALVALPLNGYGSDALIKWKAKRNNGIHEPEVRLIPLVIPAIVGTFSTVLYGAGAQNPYHYSWFTYVWVVAGSYFSFVGANIVAITYLLDSYPARAGPLLVIICAFRGIISFGVSYGIAPFIARNGYLGTFGTFGGLTAALALFAVPLYFWGKNIRQVTGRFARSETRS